MVVLKKDSNGNDHIDSKNVAFSVLMEFSQFTFYASLIDLLCNLLCFMPFNSDNNRLKIISKQVQ